LVDELKTSRLKTKPFELKRKGKMTKEQLIKLYEKKEIIKIIFWRI
jgi:hypothetical protein